MASNTMNFGPEWMRRFPSKTNSSSASPFLQDDWSQPAPGSTPGNATAGNAGAAAFSYSSVAANNVRSGISSTVPAFETSASDHLPSDTLNPFKYSKELMLSLFKPAGFPIEFERHEYATNEDALMPMSSQPFSDQAFAQLILSGSVNSEVARRVVQPGEGGQQERGQGQRTEGASGGEQSGRHDRHDRPDRRHHDAKYQGSGSRTRHLTSDDRSHSFKRSEQGNRDKEDGLWNSPGRSTVGSFDANGVFRVTSEQGEALESSDQDEAALEPRQTQDKGSVLPDTTASDTSAFHNAQQTPSNGPLSNGAEHSDAGPDPETSRSRGLLNEGLVNGDKYVFSNGNTESSSIRDEASFAPFGSSNPSAFNSAPAFNAAPAELSKWLYRDPSGSVQGPFQSMEMHEWYKGGFFSMDLLVKREQDVNFEPLGSLIRRLANEEKPFLVADLQATPLARPTISLPQSRQFSSASWGGLSAPTTPGTPSFGVDRLFQQQQQQQQQQQHAGDMFGNSGGQHHHHQHQHQHQQQHQQPQQQQPHDAFSGYEQKWNAYGHQQNALDSNAGWAGDAFARSSAMGGLAGPQTPMAGSFASQQQRLLNQQLERQQYMQLLQRQIQMQHMLHQQQFMAAQQQFGNDPHALAALVAQQQVQQRQLQMRLQQLQHMGFMTSNASTPGGSAIPSLNGLGQPSSPWSTSIIQSSSDNYFDRAHGENNNAPHSMEQHQEEPHPRQDEQALQQEQHASHEQPQEQQPQEHAQEQSASDSQEQIEAVSDRLEQLDVTDAIEKVEEIKHTDNDVWPSQVEFVEQRMPAVESELAESERETELEEQVQEEAAAGDEPTEEVDENESQPKEETPAASWDAPVPETSTWGETTESSTWGATEQPRLIKAVPAPWAKPVGGEEASEKTLSLREIQEIEAKRAEEQRAAERDAQIASGASGLLDFGRGLGGTPWQTASAPKKTLRQIQEEEEAAALRKARAAQVAPSASAPASAPVTAVSAAGTSIGLAGIVAAGTNSGGKRYADTIGPKPTTTAVSSGPWGSSSSMMAAKAAPVTRAPSAPAASHGSFASSVRAAPRVEDNHGWIEVSSQKSSSTTAGTVTEPTPTRTAPLVQKKTSSDEPREASEDFLRWCRQALKGLQGVVLEDFIQMLLSFPLNPDPMTVEIIQDSIYANSQSLNGRQFADEFIKRRKADAYPNGMGNSANGASSNNSSNQQSGSAHDGSFKVVSKKGRKKGTA
ncbi:unnamed protein product [Mortierella alpina]